MVIALLLGCVVSHGDFPIIYHRNNATVNAFYLEVNLSRTGPVTGTCTGEGEVHRLQASGDNADPWIPVLGLLADTDYDCELTADGMEAGITVHTPALPPAVPDTWELVTDTTDDQDYTLFNHLVGDRDLADGRLVIVDHEGRVRWYWEYDHYGGDIDATLGPDGNIWLGGGYGLEPTIVSLDGTVLYTAGPSQSGGSWHHEVQPFDDGTYASFAVQELQDPDDRSFSFTGFRMERRDPADDSVVWSWVASTAVNAGFLDVPYSSGADAYHANAAIWNPEIDPGGVWVSLRNDDSILRIDEATGEVGWKMSPYDGDWRLVKEDGSADDSANWFYGQHAPELDGDVLYMHDNGTGRPGGNSSRAVAYRVNLEEKTLTQLWSWTEPHWYEQIWGDVDLLPSGHVLVTQGHCPDCEGGNTRSAIVELDPATNEVVWELKAPTLDHMTYRAQRIPGCDLFANETICPELGE